MRNRLYRQSFRKEARKSAPAPIRRFAKLCRSIAAGFFFAFFLSASAAVDAGAADKHSPKNPQTNKRGFFHKGEREWMLGRFDLARDFFLRAKEEEERLTPAKERVLKNRMKILRLRRFSNPYFIGAVLPLSGRRAALGQKVLNGLSLGLGLMEDSPERLIVQDSQSRPEVVSLALKKLLQKRRIIGAVGGLSGETAQAMARVSENLGIPSLLLSQKQGLGQNRIFIFQTGISGKALMRRLSEHLIKNKIQKAAVLFPEDNYGRSYAAFFKQAFQKAGGQITGQESYPPEEADFKIAVRKLVHLYYIQDRRKEYESLKQKFLEENPRLSLRDKQLSPERLLEPKVDFQALFIPDSSQSLRRIVSYLEYFHIKDILLAGTHLWKPNRLQDIAQKFPLVFPSPRHSEKARQKSSFYIKYRAAFQTAPGFFEEEAYNTGLALKKALRTRPKDRLELQQALNSLQSFEGAGFSVKVEDRTFVRPIKLHSLP